MYTTESKQEEKTQDEETWLNIYTWGFHPHLDWIVTLKFTSTISQPSGYARATELAIRPSQRSGDGAAGGQGRTCQTGVSSSGGDSQGGSKFFIPGRGRSDVCRNQRGGRGQGGRRRGERNHERRWKQRQQLSSAMRTVGGADTILDSVLRQLSVVTVQHRNWCRPMEESALGTGWLAWSRRTMTRNRQGGNIRTHLTGVTVV